MECGASRRFARHNRTPGVHLTTAKRAPATPPSGHLTSFRASNGPCGALWRYGNRFGFLGTSAAPSSTAARHLATRNPSAGHLTSPVGRALDVILKHEGSVAARTPLRQHRPPRLSSLNHGSRSGLGDASHADGDRHLLLECGASRRFAPSRQNHQPCRARRAGARRRTGHTPRVLPGGLLKSSCRSWTRNDGRPPASHASHASYASFP
jgi:hypothetical protein